MLKDKVMYEKYVRETTAYIPNLYSSNFDFLWSSSGPMYGKAVWKIVDGMLVVFRLYKNRKLKLPFLPLGPGKLEQIIEVLYKCAMFCHKWNGEKKDKSILIAVNSTQLDLLNKIDSFNKRFYPVKLLGVDRHVSVQKLLELKGREFQNIRNAINKFNREYPNVVIRRGNVDDLEALIKLKKEWNQTLGQKYARIRDDLRYRRTLKYQKELNHIVLIAELNGQIIGMSSGGILPHGQAWAGFHKKKEGYYGLSEHFYIEFAREIHRIDPRVETIDLGGDAGAGDGLRNFKNKFRPILNEERFSLYLK